MIQITNEQDMIGKTITRIRHLGYNGIMAIFFEYENEVGNHDGEYAIFQAHRGWERGDEEIRFTEEEQEDYTLRDLGVITEEEYEITRTEERLASEKAMQTIRRAQYEKLRKEFEDDN